MCIRDSFKDDMSIISKWMNDCQLIIYITRVKYGCFDIPFKKMLERLVVNHEPFYLSLIHIFKEHGNRKKEYSIDKIMSDYRTSL